MTIRALSQGFSSAITSNWLLKGAHPYCPTSAVSRRFFSSANTPSQTKKLFCKKSLAVGGILGAGIAFGLSSRRNGKLEVSTELNQRMKPYFDLLDKHPQVLGPIGNSEEGEIEIIRDPQKIAEIEKKTGQKVGILADNQWQCWINDAVKFPNGTYGTYGRFFWKQSLKGVTGAVVWPVLPDGRILLISIYRHALRRWVLEIPRGNGDGIEITKRIVERELKEETGAEIGSMTYLGKMNPDSGITLGDIPVVKVNISKIGETNRDAAETSIHLHAFTREELNEGIRKGFIPVKINGKLKNVEVGTDGYMLSAMALNDLAPREQK